MFEQLTSIRLWAAVVALSIEKFLYPGKPIQSLTDLGPKKLNMYINVYTYKCRYIISLRCRVDCVIGNN